MPAYPPVSWARMSAAVEAVRFRLLRAATALDAAGVPYAVVGGNAVAAWVARVDESAVRNTPNVELIAQILSPIQLNRPSRLCVGLVHAATPTDWPNGSPAI